MRIQTVDLDEIEVGRAITSFLSEKSIVFFGLSTDESDFSWRIYQAFKDRGYIIHGVNPKFSNNEEMRQYNNIQSIPENINAAYILTNSEITKYLVTECVNFGISKIWLHQGVGEGAVSKLAIDYCLEYDIELVPGYCPMMFLDNTNIIHRCHSWIRKLKRKYPIIENST